MARGRFVSDATQVGSRVDLIGIDAAIADLGLQRGGKRSPDTTALRIDSTGRPAFSPASSRIFRKSGVPL
jgi:hypothetical protein